MNKAAEIYDDIRNAAPVVDGLRDAIRLAIAEDDPDKYPNMTDYPSDGCGLTNKAIDRCADIAYATVVNQHPMATTREAIRTEMERCWWIVKNYSPAVSAETQLVLSDIMAKIDQCDDAAGGLAPDPEIMDDTQLMDALESKRFDLSHVTSYSGPIWFFRANHIDSAEYKTARQAIRAAIQSELKDVT